ncbi:MAG TPA: DUF1761 domain-containing protein [Flavobacteriales bacterium]|jgi:hypothetical protein|nr:DUF1761 domain-containing protein [Flavobacteriales bacterium]
MEHINHLAILVCAVSIFLLGAPWYSPALFGKAWARASGVPLDPKERKGSKHPARVFGVSFVMAWIAAYAFAILVGPVDSLHHWLHHGLVCGAGIAATSFAINYQFADRSLTLLAIDGGYHIVQFVLYGLILGLWR